MPSETTPSQVTSIHSPGKDAASILQNLKDGNSPLEFILNNSKSIAPQIAPNTQPISVNELLNSATSEIIQKPKEEIKEVLKEEIKEIAVTTPSIETTPQKIEVKEDDELDILPDNSTGENFKKLRTKLKETSKTLKEIENDKYTLTQTLEKYNKGEAVPEATQKLLKEKEQRIADLEKYEKIVNLKTSKEYVDNFITPITEVKTKINEIAKDYSIPEDVMAEVLTLNNRAEINRFLSDHFDDVGALEVKQLIDKVKNIEHEAKEAENKPTETLINLQLESTKLSESLEVNRKNKIHEQAESSWDGALDFIKKEGKAKELIFKENDTEYNNTYIKPVVEKARDEYQKLVTGLRDLGLKGLSPELAHALARMTLHAISSYNSIDTREAAVQTINELEKNVKRTTNYIRPPIGGGAPGVGNVSPRQTPENPAESAAANLLESTLSKRSRF